MKNFHFNKSAPDKSNENRQVKIKRRKRAIFIRLHHNYTFIRLLVGIEKVKRMIWQEVGGILLLIDY